MPLALRAHDQMIGLELSDVALDACITKAPCGRELAGPCRGGPAQGRLECSVATENYGIPLGIASAGANRHALASAGPHLAGGPSPAGRCAARRAHLPH